MIRKAIIIYCDDTESGELKGPIADNINLNHHLTSTLGGEWYDSEILSLNNPTKSQVRIAIARHLSGADYTFVVFSGHGYISTLDDKQYVELADGDITVRDLLSNAKRQTIIIDACRGYYTPTTKLFSKGVEGIYDSFTGEPSTRKLFSDHVLNCEAGLTVLFAASENESATDSDKGGAYLYSLLKVCELWNGTERGSKLSVKNAHDLGTKYMKNNFDTIQNPAMNSEKRKRYFPLAVKWTAINE
jgi:hypothetical protein